MKYCCFCGEQVAQKIPDGDDRLRFICVKCDIVHYQNPSVIVGVIPVHDRQVLLCRRAIEPRKGLWTVPAGFMENGETTTQGAIRETWEEARANVASETLYRLYDLPNINQVYVLYLAELLDHTYSAGPESLEVKLFAEQDIPWDDIAFPVITQALRDYFADYASGTFPVKVSEQLTHWQS